jgi:putative mRNA 3-end processing factor
MASPLLEFNNKGIYCSQADVYLDPWRPVKTALITHGHADHARWGHKAYITHKTNVPILKHRLGVTNVVGKNWNETFVINGVKFSFHPAGHVIGSAQIRVEYKGEVWVFTGDYKTEDDGVCVPYEVVKCHTFITECTFGLPVFKWQPQAQVMNDINEWWAENKAEGKTSVLFGYSLGKAQRILKYLDPSLGTIFTHGSIENMTRVLRAQVDFPETTLVTTATKKEQLLGSIVIAPPSVNGSSWIRRMTPFVTGSASGWMAFRGAKNRNALDRGFPLSDHCDFQGLLDSISATGAEKIIATHGYSDLFSKYLRELGYDARTAETQYDGEKAENETNDSVETESAKILQAQMSNDIEDV